MHYPRLILSRRRFMTVSLAASACVALPGLLLARADYRETVVTDGGMIKGKVSFRGALPKAEKILISKDNALCGSGHVVPDSVTLAANGQVTRAIVAIKKIAAGKPWSEISATPKILQEKCRFQPYIQVARKGAKLTIHNKDPLLHNIHAFELIGRARRTIFNIAQPEAGKIETHLLKTRRSNLVEIDCDAHGWMSAWVYLSNHPYAEISDENGQFSMDEIPPGKYQLVAWHPVFGRSKQQVTIAANTPLSLDIELKL